MVVNFGQLLIDGTVDGSGWLVGIVMLNRLVSDSRW